MEDMIRAWSDWILPGIPISAHLALPQPTTDGNADVLHVLLLQNERAGLCSILLQTHVIDRDYRMNMLIAVTVARIGGYEMLFQVAGLGRHCLLPLSDLLCKVTCGNHDLPNNRPIHMDDAMTITISVYNDLNPDSSPFRELIEEDDEDITLLMQRGQSSGYNEQPATHVSDTDDSGVCLPTPTEEHPPNMSMVVPDIQDSWQQQLKNAWVETQKTFPRPDADLEIRSWFLDPTRISRCEVWRPIALPVNSELWFDIIRITWHDVLVDNAIEIFFVRPDPPRSPPERKYSFDIIVTQNRRDFDRPAIIVSKLLSYTIRFHTMAELLPPSISKWQLLSLDWQ